MDAVNRWHVGAGLAVAALGAFSWLFGWNGYLSALAVILSNGYLIATLMEASLRAQQDRVVLNGIPQPKPPRFMVFPDLAWTLLQVQSLLIVVIFGFANMYIKTGDVRYQGASPAVEQSDRKAVDSEPPTPAPPPSMSRVDALYFSAVTISTVGYGDFAPTSSRARLLVLWELGTGMLMLLGVFPLIVGRISNF